MNKMSGSDWRTSVNLKGSTIVQPAAETPGGTLWISDVDLLMPNIHVSYLYLYRRPNSNNQSPDFFFDAPRLVKALSNALVFFYPLAGRLTKGEEDGRIAINCNAEGALFVEACTDSTMDDFGGFAPNSQLFTNLAPQIDASSSSDIASCPLLLAQVTHFKCGGVSLMVLVHHTVADGSASMYFINTWAELARGRLSPSVPPFLDRTLLRPRHPPTTPSLPHIEFKTNPPSLDNSRHANDSSPVTVSIFRLSRQQIDLLKAQALNSYTTFETLAAHVWRCSCGARELSDDQQTKLYIPVNGRTRLRPPLPPGYFGNALFTATPMATWSELKSGPLAVVAARVHEALKGMNDECLRSAMDHAEEGTREDPTQAARGPRAYSSPNLRIVSWNRMPIHDADFGWGGPVFAGPGLIPVEGMCLVSTSAPESNSGSESGGSFYLSIALQSHHMDRFKESLYRDIC